jgi:tRNA pseudouridine13 synthase
MIPDSWHEAALSPPRGLDLPRTRGRLRAEIEDFVVEEELGFSPDGAGQHVLLRVKKRNANTEWVARALARAADCRAADVGYAGLKDRRAIAVQWFSVPARGRSLEAWRDFSDPEFEVLEACPHGRKLPRGALKSNHFRICVRDLDVDLDALSAALEAIGTRGVPNYFGPQRFGRDGGNLARLQAGPPRGRADGFVLSSARSLIFNAVLAERVRDGSWEQLERGDVANLDARGSVFEIPEVSPELLDRCRRLDIHPTGPLWGRGELLSKGRPLELERTRAGSFPEACALVVAAGMVQERRALRLGVRDLAHHYERASKRLTLSFTLGRGSFATAVLRELFELDPLAGD